MAAIGRSGKGSPIAFIDLRPAPPADAGGG
jgi:hypothetical protein